jgi:hypothetical protein
MDTASDQADAESNTGEYTESYQVAIYNVLTNLTKPRDTREFTPYASVIGWWVKPGAEREFTAIFKLLHEAVVKADVPINYTMYALESGGKDAANFVMGIPRDNWAAMSPARRGFINLLDKTYGRNGAELIFKRFSNAMTSVSNEIYVLRPDLSYTP